MLVHKIPGSDIQDANYWGIQDAKTIEIDWSNNVVKVDFDYLLRLEEKCMNQIRQNADLRYSLESTDRRIDSITYKLKTEYNHLKKELDNVIKKTAYIDLDYEALRLLFIEKETQVLNLEEELRCIKINAMKGVTYPKEYVEQHFNEYLSEARDRLKDLVPEKYTNALKEIGILNKKIRQLEIDNKILTEKVGKEVKHSERIKNGYDSVSKSDVTKEVIESLMEQGLSKTAIAKQLNVTRQTIHNKLKRGEHLC